MCGYCVSNERNMGPKKKHEVRFIVFIYIDRLVLCYVCVFKKSQASCVCMGFCVSNERRMGPKKKHEVGFRVNPVDILV